MLRPSLPALPFEKSRDCASSTGAAAGVSAMVSLAFAFAMAQPAWPSYTGRKLMESGVESSKSSATLTDYL